MKALRERWKIAASRYAALSKRERMLLAAALVLGPFLLGNMLFLEPLSKRASMLEKGIAAQNASLNELQAQILVLGQQLNNDPDAAKKAELTTLSQTRDTLDQEINTLGSALVSPAQMNALLEQLLARHGAVRLVSLKTRLPTSVLASATADEPKEMAGKKQPRAFDLFRHGVEIRLEGSYSDLLAYVAQLEQHRSRLMFEQLNYRVIDYPKAELTISVFTLSPDRAWLSL